MVGRSEGHGAVGKEVFKKVALTVDFATEVIQECLSLSTSLVCLKSNETWKERMCKCV